MRIEEKTVVFKSSNRWYGAEKSGNKPYTVRILEEGEFYGLAGAGIEQVRIVHVLDERAFFVRKFLSAYPLEFVFGKIVAGIAWDPRTEMKRTKEEERRIREAVREDHPKEEEDDEEEGDPW